MSDKILVVRAFAGCAPEFRRGPQSLVGALDIAIFTGCYSRRILEGHVGIFSAPSPRFASLFRVARGELRIKRPVYPRGDRRHGRKVGGCASALVRLLAGSNHF